MDKKMQPIAAQINTAIWSSRRACLVRVRIEYQMHEERGCKIYTLKAVEELEKRAA